MTVATLLPDVRNIAVANCAGYVGFGVTACDAMVAAVLVAIGACRFRKQRRAIG